MLIQIFTQTQQTDNGFIYRHFHFVDFQRVATASNFNEGDDKLEADIINLGLAVKSVIESDLTFGGCIIPSKQMKMYNNETKEDYFITAYERNACYKNPLAEQPPIKVKRLATCYTDNEYLMRLLQLPMLAEQNRKMIDRLFNLSLSNRISLNYGNVKRMNDRVVIEQLKKIYE